MDVSHALSCRKGGLVIRRHNEIRDSLGDLMAMGFNSVLKEPIVLEGDVQGDNQGLVADLAVRRLWQPQTEALFDVRVIDTDAESHRRRSVDQVIQFAENEKKSKYLAAVEERRGSFTPFVMSVDGYMGQEADRTLRRLAEVLVWKWEKHYSSVVNWVRAYMSMSIIRATNMLCLRGSRIKWRTATGQVLKMEEGYLCVNIFVILNHHHLADRNYFMFIIKFCLLFIIIYITAKYNSSSDSSYFPH